MTTSQIKQMAMVMALASIKADGLKSEDLTDDELQVYIDLAVLDLKLALEAQP